MNSLGLLYNFAKPNAKNTGKSTMDFHISTIALSSSLQAEHYVLLHSLSKERTPGKQGIKDTEILRLYSDKRAVLF